MYVWYGVVVVRLEFFETMIVANFRTSNYSTSSTNILFRQHLPKSCDLCKNCLVLRVQRLDALIVL